MGAFCFGTAKCGIAFPGWLSFLGKALSGQHRLRKLPEILVHRGIMVSRSCRYSGRQLASKAGCRWGCIGMAQLVCHGGTDMLHVLNLSCSTGILVTRSCRHSGSHEASILGRLMFLSMQHACLVFLLVKHCILISGILVSRSRRHSGGQWASIGWEGMSGWCVLGAAWTWSMDITPMTTQEGGLQCLVNGTFFHGNLFIL